jgi:hypothetical protein
VAYLIANGIEPEGMVKEEGNNAMFYFEKTDELQKVIDKYNQDEELKKFISAYKEVRKRIITYKN